MRKSPDGKSEVIEMLVPMEGSISRTVRVTGLGLPPKIGVGAVDLPDSTWIEILNRDIKGHLAYDTVETVRGGMMPLADRFLQDGDQIFSARSGATFGKGQLAEPDDGAGQVEKVEDGSAPGPTSAWIVTDAARKCLLVLPHVFDSFQVAEMISEAMHGEFMVEMVTSGSMTAREEIAAPGWRVLLYPPVWPGIESALRH